MDVRKRDYNARRRSLVAALGAALLAVTAASPAPADVTDRITRVLTIAPGTPIAVQITIGDLAIHGWDRPDLSVEITRRAPSAQQLAGIPAEVQQTGDGVTVRAVQAGDGRDRSRRTDVVLRVPAASQLRDVTVFEGRIELSDLRGACTARIERGAIEGSRLSGALRLETAIGNIRLERATLSRGPIRLRTFNGDVALELARMPEHARILALSLGGTIHSDIPLTLKDAWGPRFGEAKLGNGEPVISIDVVNGNVAIRVPAGGR